MADPKKHPVTKADTSGHYYAKDSLTYMPASAKSKLKLDDPQHNHNFAKRHSYQPMQLPHPVTGKMVPAIKPGTERAITRDEYLEANLITDLDPEQAQNFIEQGLMIRASDVAAPTARKPAPDAALADDAPGL